MKRDAKSKTALTITASVAEDLEPEQVLKLMKCVFKMMIFVLQMRIWSRSSRGSQIIIEESCFLIKNLDFNIKPAVGLAVWE